MNIVINRFAISRTPARICNTFIAHGVQSDKKRLEKGLQHSQKMEAIGTLAGGIAHDFNNLLMSIQGYATMMRFKMKKSDKYCEPLTKIEELVQSGANLTRQILGFAHGGNFEILSSNLNEIIEKTSIMFGRTKKEIQIKRKYQDDLWTVDVDRGQIEQVLLNLYVNAWHAMPGGSWLQRRLRQRRQECSGDL